MLHSFDQQIVRGRKILDNLNMIEGKVDRIINKPELNIEYKENELLKNNSTSFRFTQSRNSKEQAVNDLDHLLFDDILHSRKIFQKIEGVEDSLLKLKNERQICEDKLKKEIKDNLALKQAITELEKRNLDKNLKIKKNSK
jgi:hypothetical protein